MGGRRKGLVSGCRRVKLLQRLLAGGKPQGGIVGKHMGGIEVEEPLIGLAGFLISLWA
jgi:hypothetical protein